MAAQFTTAAIPPESHQCQKRWSVDLPQLNRECRLPNGLLMARIQASTRADVFMSSLSSALTSNVEMVVTFAQACSGDGARLASP
jgi:hypothetical protein